MQWGIGYEFNFYRLPAHSLLVLINIPVENKMRLVSKVYTTSAPPEAF